ncbi:TetR family transcriptional regulator, partial [Escherichia coli]|nr:TetR family transcriptional regulator [Escherichia coli]
AWVDQTTAIVVRGVHRAAPGGSVV